MRIEKVSLTFLFVFLLVFSSQSFAQSGQADSCDVPLVVMRFNVSTGAVEPVRDLGPANFQVRLNGVATPLHSASVDSGPKRIAVILDGSQKIPQNEWEMETEMAAYFVELGRPKDRFALLYVGMDGSSDSFLTSGEADERIRKLMVSRPARIDSDERTLDALLAAASRLDPPMFGDSLFLFGHPEDTGSKKDDPDKVIELIMKNRIRFYGVSFLDPLMGKLTPAIDINKPLPADLLALVSPKLAEMSAATGYNFSFHSLLALSQPGQTRLFRGFLQDVYSGIAEPYRLNLFTSTDLSAQTKLDISIADLNDQKINSRDFHYPKYIFPCASPRSSDP